MTDAPDPDSPEPEPTGPESTGPELSGAADSAPEDSGPADGAPEDAGPGPELSDAVEDALRPATHDAVMAVWQRVVLGRLDRGQPTGDDEEILRRLYEGERPEDPPT